MDNWQKAPQPVWYQDPTGQFPWEVLMGQFLNTPAGSSNHIDNIHGNQGAFIFALPEVAVFQDYNTVSGTNGQTHQFNAVYEAGKSYSLTVGVMGGGGGMTNGATFQISLYYRDASSNAVTVAATTVTNTAGLFPTNTHLVDFQARAAIVRPTDAWFGKQIGIRLASTVGFDLQGGYWDIDNVRLTENLVPNGSFESPETPFADPRMDNWRKSPQPVWYQDPSGQFPWEALMGQFLNTAAGTSNHIDNVDGNQAAFIFALPDVAISQDYNSLTGTNTTPNHDFNVKFEAGKSYALTVGVIGGGGGMTNPATLQISLYYRDASSNAVTVAATTITNTAALFPTNSHFIDFQTRTPIVRTNDAWVGQSIGVRVASTVGFDLQGGYWDIDNVRLTESIVPNGSFESPETPFADPRMDNWQKAPQPVWYQDPSGQFPWEALVGQFLNTAVGTSNHIDNVEGKQAAFIFALPDVAVSQELSRPFEIGKSYALTVGVMGGGGGMTNPATLQLSLYYRDAASNQVTVAATTITNSAGLFPTGTHLTDFRVTVPTVSSTDAWAGKPIGVRLASTVGFDRQGGYWDVDNVRIEIIQSPILVNSGTSTNGQFEFTLESPQGRFEVLGSTNVALPSVSWTSLGTVTNVTGSASFTDTNSNIGQKFYQIRQAP